MRLRLFRGRGVHYCFLKIIIQSILQSLIVSKNSILLKKDRLVISKESVSIIPEEVNAKLISIGVDV